jgi:hypothetical protein
MPSQVNRVPPGLLSLLGIKSTGVNPTMLGEELTPTMDLTQMYAAGHAVSLFGTTGVINATGMWDGGGLTQVPAGEFWICDSVCITSTAVLGAGTIYRGRAAVADVTGGIIRVLGPTSGNVTQTERFATQLQGPIYVRPNETIGVFIEGFTAGVAQAFNVSGRLLRLSI